MVNFIARIVVSCLCFVFTLSSYALVERENVDEKWTLVYALNKIHLDVLGDKEIRYFHVELGGEYDEGKTVVAGKPFGTVELLPEVISDKYQNEFRRSLEFYEKGFFIEAANELRPIVTGRNIHILNQFARSLYKTPATKFESFHLYRNIVKMLNTQVQGEGVAVDMWFLEANWKLGTLYMDKRLYKEALEEMAKLLVGNGFNLPPTLLAQVLEYVSEAYYYQKDYVNADYYANFCLLINPQNEYVKDYLILKGV